MRFYKWLVAIIFLGCTSGVWGQNGQNCFPCADSFCNMRYHVYADYLYWKVFRSGIGEMTTGDDGADLFVSPDYSSGYRVGGRILWNCLDLGVRYASYDTSTRHISVLQATTGDFSLNYRIDFQTVDVELGALFCFNCGNNFLRPYVGAKFLWLDEKVDRFLTQQTIKLHDCAYGLYIGAEGKLGFFNICNVAIGLRARGSFGLLNGTNRLKIQSQTSDTNFAKECHVIDVTDVFAGLDISYCDFSCFDLNVQIGYELQSYVRDFITFNQVLTLDNVALGGLVVRFGVYF